MTEEVTDGDCMLRPMSCEINLLSRSDGSAMFMQGDTAVIAGVNGPIEAKSQKMVHDRVSVEVTYTPLGGPAKVDDRLIETYIRESCEAAVLLSVHPNTMMCINLQEMQDSGGLLACAINASCLALINSGLSMKCTIAAISCMVEKETGEIIIDPDSTQLKNAKAEFTYTFDNINKDVVSCHSVGRFSQSEFLASMDKCRQVSQYVFAYYREVTRKEFEEYSENFPDSSISLKEDLKTSSCLSTFLCCLDCFLLYISVTQNLQYHHVIRKILQLY